MRGDFLYFALGILGLALAVFAISLAWSIVAFIFNRYGSLIILSLIGIFFGWILFNAIRRKN